MTVLWLQVPKEVHYSPSATSSNCSVLVVVGKREDTFLRQSGERVRLQVVVNRKPPPEHSAAAPASASPAPDPAPPDPPPLFSVCVPPLFGRLSVLQLVEFVELHRLLGAAHFTFYTVRVSRDLARLLAWYEGAGVARVLPWSLPAPNDVWARGRGAAAGDCLFRNMHLFRYVAFHDLDQFLVPRGKAASWRELLAGVHAGSENVATIAAAYEMRPVTFYPAGADGKSLAAGTFGASGLQSEASRFLTLRSTLRGSVSSSNFSRLLVRPDRLLELDVHRVVKPISELFVTYKVDPHTASVHHYRQQSCSQTPEDSAVERCDELSEDRTVWRYKNLLVERTKMVLQQLNRLGPSLT